MQKVEPQKYEVEQQDDGQWTVAIILCDEAMLKGKEYLGAFQTLHEAINYLRGKKGEVIRWKGI